MKNLKLLNMVILAIMLSTNLGYAQHIKVQAIQKQDQSHWVDTKIKEAIEKNILESEDNFKPEENITRYEFVKMMNKVLMLEAKSSKTFSDLEAESDVGEEILKAVEKGYIAGYEDNTIRANDTLTRQEGASMVSSALSLTNNSLIAKKYSDFDHINDYAKGSVGAVTQAQIMGGNTDKTFEPQGKLTKAQALTITLNIQKNYLLDTIISQDGQILWFQIDEDINLSQESLGNIELQGFNKDGEMIINKNKTWSGYITKIAESGDGDKYCSGYENNNKYSNILPKDTLVGSKMNLKTDISTIGPITLKIIVTDNDGNQATESITYNLEPENKIMEIENVIIETEQLPQEQIIPEDEIVEGI